MHAAAHRQPPPDAALPRPDAAAPDAGGDAVAARARAYLDLWERHLTHLALHGPSLPPSGGPPAA